MEGAALPASSCAERFRHIVQRLHRADQPARGCGLTPPQDDRRRETVWDAARRDVLQASRIRRGIFLLSNSNVGALTFYVLSRATKNSASPPLS